jgi:opacity protein-like surface antigen
MFGLDAASIRLGLDYGVTPWLNVGIGRSSFEKVYDGFVKVRVLRQQTGKRNVPVHLLLVSDMAIVSQRNTNSEIEPYYFSNRLNYTHQFILGRKFSDGFSLQVMPSLVHRNFVMTKSEANDVFVVGVGGRVKLTKRVALNAEYYYVPAGQLASGYTNSLSVGFDIETGGHVFQLHFTNSTGMVENAFMTQTNGKWNAGDIHFGFNVSRVFTVHRPKRD